MKLSKLNEIPYKRHMIDAFGGYNHNIRIGEGEFYDMKNLTSDKFPSLSPRKKRGIFRPVPEKPLGMISKDKFVYVNGSSIFIGDEEIPDFLDDETEKSLVSMGAYIIILPDKKYINTQDSSDKGNIEARVTIDSGSVGFTLCDKEGVNYLQPEALGSSDIKKQATAPTAADYGLEILPSGTYWIDTSDEQYVLKIYDANRSMWTVVAQTYIKIRASEEGADSNEKPFNIFNAGDGITISGIVEDEVKQLNTNIVIEKVRGIGTYKTDIIVKGMVGNDIKQNCGENPITFKRKMPDLDFVIESENRLWGCKYGEVDGKIVNEIYASKLGDFKNWNCFADISTDSYVVSVGTDGKFTGAISYLGHPLFFKENFIHKVYGNFPSNFQMQTTACRGVQYQSSKSLAIVNEMLIYKARNGICAYDGSLPVEISSQFGNERYNSAVGGVLGNKYYVSMKNSNNE